MCKVKICACVLLTLICTVSLFSESVETKDRIVFIRVDNLFMRYTDIQPQEIDEFLNIVEKHDARAILSVIPARLRQGPNKNGLMSRQLRDYANRGHQIAQNGYDHICPFTDNTSYEFYNPEVEDGYSREERLDKIQKGKKMLEAVIGRKVITYVGTGADHNYMPEEDVQALFEMGFVSTPKYDEIDFDPEENKALGIIVSAHEFTWGLTEDNYADRMAAFQNDFLEAVETDKKWSFHLHDHFTRAAYNEGIVLRWFDEAMEWLHSLEEYNITHPTIEEYYQQFDPDFTARFY